MGIINRLMNVFGYTKAKRVFQIDPGYGGYGNLGRSAQQNYRSYLQQYADVSWVYACIKRIAMAGAGVPVKLYKKIIKSGKISYEEIMNHPVLELLATVNPLMDGFGLIEATLSFQDLTGNAYWLLDSYVSGKPTEIYPLNPYRVKVVPHPTEFIKEYRYDVGQNKVIPIAKEFILHFKNFNPVDDYYGLSPISAGRLAIDTQNFGDTYNRNFFVNSAEPKGSIVIEGELTQDQRNRIIAAWNSAHRGVANAHKVMIEENGLKWEQRGLSQKDMDFVNSKKMTREDILGVFGVPPAMVGVFEYASYANAKEQYQIFWRDTIIPKLKKMENTINSFLINIFDPNLYLEFDLSGVKELKDDELIKAQVNQILTGAGIKTINEAREEIGMDKVGWGDTWNAPMNLIPISSPKGEPAMPAPAEEESISGELVMKPYPQEHSCRLNPPDKYDKFARKNCAVKSDGKCIDFIYGVKEGKSELQAMRYNKDIWTESEARNHCNSKDGKFEPAGEKIIKQEDDEKAREKVINDKIWYYFKARTEVWERKFKPILRDEFTNQERETIRNLRDHGWKEYRAKVLGAKKENIKQNIDVIIFDEKEAGKVMRKKSKPIISGALADSAKIEIARLGLGIDFDVTNPEVIKWIDEKLFKFSFEVNDATINTLRDQLKEAVTSGEGIVDVEKRIENVFDMARGYRTERIARTEIISASNEGNFAAYEQSGVVEKKSWISSRDNDVRLSHQIDDDEPVGLDEPFSNGLMYPGDPAGGPEEVINCRCSFKGVVKV